MKNLILLSICILSFSCSINQKEDKETNNDLVDTSKRKSHIKNDTELNVEIGLFNSIPDTIDGCGDFYSYEIKENQKRTYIFLSNLTEFSIMKIDGQTEYFKIEQDSLSDFSGDNYTQTAFSEKYRLVCDFSLLKKYDEGGLYKLRLILIDKLTKRRKEIHLIGESGC
ncbi:MAG TPA: hypothetical protein DCQ29_09755 [Chitinophagaceae bacterium]|nr:hypothetical protein [Chitinophagaceae bacterium]